MRLTPDEPEAIKARMDDAKSRRLATQPHGSRSAGCFFKNPPASTIGTGKMIDNLGMKGTRRGTALVSPVHANFIVTEGENARAEDALALAEEIRERVRREQGSNWNMKLSCGGQLNSRRTRPPSIRCRKTSLRPTVGRSSNVREQVINQKVGNRSGIGGKGKGSAAAQRPVRRDRESGLSVAARLRNLVGYLPAALKIGLAVVIAVLIFLGYRAAAAASFFRSRVLRHEVSHARRMSRWSPRCVTTLVKPVFGALTCLH